MNTDLLAHACVSVAAGAGWLFLAVLVGPLEWVIIQVWIGFVLVHWFTWALRRGLRGDGTDHDDGWNSFAAMVGLAGSRVKAVSRDGDTVRATVQVRRGVQTWENVKGAGKWMASFLGMREQDVYVEQDPVDSAVAHLTISTEDHLTASPRWAGPSARDASIADAPCLLGNRESGNPLQLWLPADENLSRSLQHVLVTGMMGSGKSLAGRLLICEVGSRRDTEIWLGDPVKGRQFLGPVAHLAKHVAATIDDCLKMIVELQALITVRGDHLGDRGLDNWIPGCGLPFIYAHFEEVAAKIGVSPQFVNLTQHARSVGISVGASLQKASYRNLSTDARSNIATVLQFGCKEGDQGLALSKQLIDGGARPQDWTNQKPGYCFAETPGCQEGEWARPARTSFAAVADFRRLMSPTEIVDLLVGEGPGEAVMVQPPEVIPSGKASPDQAKQMFLARYNELKALGRNEIRPADFDAMLKAAGRSKTWLDGTLGKLVDAGQLDRPRHGIYAFTKTRR
jgi:hypothetical protein